MTTLNGFLFRDGPSAEPRITKGQKALVLLGATTAFDLYQAFLPPGIAKGGVAAFKVFLEEALAVLPDDRSCHSCDFKSTSGYCRHWQEEIPAAALDAGCERWQDIGAPF